MPVPTVISSQQISYPLKKSQPPQYQHRRAAAHLKARIRPTNITLDSQRSRTTKGPAVRGPRIGMAETHTVNGYIAPGANDLHSRSLHPRRQQMPSWPPSPHGLPPTPTFEDVDDCVRIAAQPNDTYQEWSTGVSRPPFAIRDNIPIPAKRAVKDTSLIVEDTDEDDQSTFINAQSWGQTKQTNAAPISVPDADLPSMIPSPSELLKFANEQARANAAVYLADWTSEKVWDLCYAKGSQGMSTLSPPSSSLRRSPSASGAIVPPSFKRFVQQTIHQVSASPAAVILALWYISRLPITTSARDLGEGEKQFMDDLLASRNEIPWRLFVLGLTFSNKWLEDNTFTTKTWHEVTGLSIASMKSLENSALALFSWQLSVSPDQWVSWLHTLRTQESTARKVIGSDRDSRDVKKPFQILDGLIVEAGRKSLSVGNIEALQGVLISDDVDMIVDFHPIDVLEDSVQTPPGLGLTLNSRTVSWPQFPVEKVTSEHARRASFEDRFPKRLPTPAAWDPAATILDSPQPPSRPRATYEAIQRPAVTVHSPWGAAPPAYESIAPSPAHVNEPLYCGQAPPPARYGYDCAFDHHMVPQHQLQQYAPRTYFQSMAPAPYSYHEVPVAMPVPDAYYAQHESTGGWPRIPNGHATRVGASVMGNALAGFGGGIFRTF